VSKLSNRETKAEGEAKKEEVEREAEAEVARDRGGRGDR